MPKMRAGDEGDRLTSSIEADRTRRRCVAAAACWAAGGGASAQAPELLLRTASQAGIAIKFNLNRAGPPGFCVELVRWLEKNDPGLRFSSHQDVYCSREEQLPQLAAGLFRCPVPKCTSASSTPRMG